MQSRVFIAIFVFMKRILQKLILLLLFTALWSCDKQPNKTGTLMDFAPQNASVVLKISNWNTLQDDIENSSLLSKFNNTTPYLFISKKAPLLKHLKPNSKSLLCINEINDSISAYTFISRLNKELFQPDSIKNKTIETLKIGEKSIQRITIDKQIAYTATIDSVFLASSSQQILMDILDGKTERDETFKKVYQLPTSSEFTALLRANNVAINDSVSINFASWSALDLSVSPESFTASGITLAADTIPQLLSIFEGQVPQQNNISSLVPMNAMGALSFTFNDAERFQKELSKFRREKETSQPTGIFDSASEVGSIDLANGAAVFIKSIDASVTSDALARFVTTHTTFREIDIKSFSEPDLFRKIFYPLIDMTKANFVFQLEDFFVFTDTETNAEEIIGAFQNNSTLKNTAFFEQTAADLSTSSSLLILKMQGEFSKAFSRFFNDKSKTNFANINLNEFPLLALQFSFDRNFSHVTLSCREFGGASKNLSKGVSEKFNLNLKATILGNPQIFENGSGSNVVVQDVDNNLHFISENGKTLWSKELGAPILGKIEQVELFGNGNKQMAFVTKNSFYILDRNGKDLNSFPLKFKDEITQPLSVFDYDSNHKYRFVVTQGKEILLYDKNGKAVKGFGFNKTKSNIVLPPAHIRIGTKDYILVAEENGKLNILSRVGKSRVTVSKSFNFSEVPITIEDNTFVVITKENTKERISEKGEVTSQKLDVGSNYWFGTSGNLKATLDDNLLRINGKLVDLPIGLYSKPELFNINRKIYIGVTEIQEKKVYLYNRDGMLMDGFPVYGSSEPSLGSDGSKNGSSLVVKGDAKSVIMYSIN